MSFKSLKDKCRNNYFSNVDDYAMGQQDIGSHSKFLSILQFNICSMNDLRKFDNLLLFINKLNTDIHLIFISETWVQSSNRLSFNIPNYSVILSCRDDRVGGGIAMYVRNDIRYNVLNIDDGTLPFQYISVQLLGFNSTTICGIYRPPCCDTKYFFDFLDNFIDNHKSTSDCVIVGDLNIPINKNLDLVSDYNSSLLSHGMVVTNTYATRPKSSNILDHTISSFINIDRVLNTTIESDISDHSFILTRFAFKERYATRSLDKVTINYSKVNQYFNEFLSCTPFDVQNPDDTLKMIIQKYNTLADKFSKHMQMQVKIKTACTCPWMTFDLWNLIKQKNRTLKRLKSCAPNSFLSNKLARLNKQIKSGKYYAKKNYYANLVNNLSQKEVWKLINQFMKNDNNTDVNKIIFKDIEYTNANSIAHIFNEHFVNVCIPPASTNNTSTDINKFRTIIPCPNSFVLFPVTDSETFNLICSLDNSKGGGYDNIRNPVIKRHSKCFSRLLTELYNVVFATGIYPDCLKISKVSPIFKTGDRKCINNYRPISVLPVFDKLLEKLIATRMTEFLNDHNFFSPHQFGFRKGAGTDLALIEIADLIYRAFDKQMYICGLFLDLRKAFDCIDHGLLLHKLYSYGFRGIAYDLLYSYLHNRKQFVKLNDVNSCHLSTKCGVPQGSVLGPLLFLIFINDITHLPLIGKIRMFADDTSIFYESKSCAQTFDDMRSDTNMLLEFFKLNKISVNFSKTKFVVFHSPFLPHQDLPLFYISNNLIERVNNFKYLGVVLDKHMYWEEHIYTLSLKISPFIYLIRKLASFVPTHLLKMIYFAFIHSRLYYGVSAFGTAAKTRLKRLQILQNKSWKAIYELPHLFPTAELYQEVAQGVLPINALFIQHLSMYMYKCLNMPSALSNIDYAVVSHCYSTRSSNLLQCARIKTEYGRKSISYIGPLVYNSLPDSIKSAENIFKFKKMLKTYLSTIAGDYLY